MGSDVNGYDFSTSNFSPQGRILQVEYAQKASENSGTAIALRGKDGVVFAVENLVTSKLYETGANSRIFTVDGHIGIAAAGLLPDARQMVEIARWEARESTIFPLFACGEFNNLFIGAEEIESTLLPPMNPVPLSYLKERLALYVHNLTLWTGFRPYGACFLMGSYEHGEGNLYHIDPSGIALRYFGCAIGKASEAAKTEIEKLDLKRLTCKDLVKEAARIIYFVHDEIRDPNFEMQLSWVGKDTNGEHKFVSPSLFADAEKYAKDALAPTDSSDEDM